MERRELEFMESLVKFLEAKIIVEVGVQFGHMATHLCRAANYNNGKYYGFDIWSEHGMINQFGRMGSKEHVESLLKSNNLKDFELNQVDTLNKRNEFISHLQRISTNGINFVFIDADHSYKGIANDFFAVYPFLSNEGVIAFHDTLRIDGCREFILDLRTKYNDGTFDISDYPFGSGSRRCGVTLLTKKSFPNIPIGIDEVCGSISESHIIEQKEIEWYKKEIENKPSMPPIFNGEILLNKIGFYNRDKLNVIK